MSYTVLARKYRSGTFDDLVGQAHVAQTLKRAIESDRIAHAFLFTGTRGTGKTSTARILAKCLNCQSSDRATPNPCGTCNSCTAIARGDDIDVIEIDAASNTQVEKTRDVIIDNTGYRPAHSRFKVYIIDEVHMLSKASFNALLKTLEEPPSHVKFILATTEVERIPNTILSRCQRYDFRNIPTREIAEHLRAVCDAEKVRADEDALLLVAKAGAGSMRDALSLLDRLLSVGERTLTTEMIESLLGLPRTQLVFDLAQSIGEGDVKQTLRRADAMISGGLSPDALIVSLVDHLRNLLILATCGPDSELVEVPGLPVAELATQAERFDPVALSQDITVLEELRRQLRTSGAGRALLDATLVRLALAGQFTSVGELLARVNGSGGGSPSAGEKKKPVADGAVTESRVGVQSVAEVTPAPVIERAPPAARFDPSPAPSRAAAPLAIAAVREGASDGERATAAPAPVASAAPVVSPLGINLDDEDEDDLPAVGKVWDSSGPSLSELMKQQQSDGAPPPASATPALAPEPSNVEPVTADFAAAWNRMLGRLEKTNMGLHGLLCHGELVTVDGGRAVVRYKRSQSSLARMFDRNGKREAVQTALSEALGETVGVTFEVEPEPENDAAVVVPVKREVSPAAAAPKPARPQAQRAPAPPPPPPVPAQRVTQEQINALRDSEPLVKALMDQMGAQVVRIEDA